MHVSVCVHVCMCVCVRSATHAHLDGGRICEYTPMHQQQHLPMEIHKPLMDVSPVCVICKCKRQSSECR